MYCDDVHVLCVFTVEKYDGVVNGDAKAKIEKFMSEDHTFDEYCQVCSVTKHYLPPCTY